MRLNTMRCQFFSIFRSKLTLGAYVRVRIEGPKLEKVFVVPRSVVHNGEQVWLMDIHDRLAIQDVTVLWSRPTELIISGLESGDRIVSSKIAAPVRGLALKTTPGSVPATAPSEQEQLQAD